LLPATVFSVQPQVPNTLFGHAQRLPELPEKSEDKALKRRLHQLIQGYPKPFEVYLYFLDLKTGSFVSIRGEEPVPAASVIKLPVLLSALQKMKDTQDRWDWRTEWPLLAVHQASGSGGLQYRKPDFSLTLKDALAYMIQQSDNSATNLLMDHVGGLPALNRQLSRFGLKGTAINTWLPDLSGTNTITCQDTAQILYTLFKTDWVDQPQQQLSQEILTHVHNNQLIPAGVPKAFPSPRQIKTLPRVIAHKTGDIGTALGDAAYIRLPEVNQEYLLTIQVKRPYNHPKAATLIQALSRSVYDSLK
jgi:beta-lactamase class A